MAQINIIDLGTIPNDGTGDVLRFGGQIINENFAELNLKKLEAGTFIGSASDLDARISNIELDYATLSTNQTFTGIKTFNVLPVSNVAPTSAFQFTNKDYVDNAISNINSYDFWNLKTNGIQRTTVQSQGDLDLTEGDGIKLSYSAGGVVEIAFINDNLGFITDAPADGAQYARQNNGWVIVDSGGQTVINSTDTIEVSTDINGDITLDAIGVANYSEWAQFYDIGLKRLVIGFNTSATAMQFIDGLVTLMNSPSIIVDTSSFTLGNELNTCQTVFTGTLDVRGGRFTVGRPNETLQTSTFWGDVRIQGNGSLSFYNEAGAFLRLSLNEDSAFTDVFLPNRNGTLAVLEQVAERSPNNSNFYVRQNNAWVLLPSGGQTSINSSDTIQATLNNEVYTLDSIGSANYSEWAQYFGTRSGGNLNVQIGDFDASNNNTYIDIVDSTGFIDLNATQGKINLNAPLITALGDFELFFKDLKFRGTGTTTITKTNSGTNTINLPNASGTFALISDTLGDAPADSEQYVRYNNSWRILNVPPSASPSGYFINGVGSYNGKIIGIGDYEESLGLSCITVGGGKDIDLYAPSGIIYLSTLIAGAKVLIETADITQDRRYQFPDKDGKFAMLSDLLGDAPADGLQYARKDNSWSVVSGGGNSYQFITENIDVNNDFSITIGDLNTSGIEVQNQSGFNYIQLGNFNFDTRVDISTTDVRIGDQFGLGTGTLLQMFSSSIAINVQTGLRLESGFNTQGVNLKLNAIAANNKYDCFFPQKIGNQTIAMLSDIDAVGAQSKSFTILEPNDEIIPLFVLTESINITSVTVSKLGTDDIEYKLGYGNTLDAIDQDVGSTETVTNNGANNIIIASGVPANNFLFLNITDNGNAEQFHITINYE